MKWWTWVLMFLMAAVAATVSVLIQIKQAPMLIPREEVMTPKIHIIDIDMNPVLMDGQRWMLHYAIDGVPWTAFFSTREKIDDYLRYLEGL